MKKITTQKMPSYGGQALIEGVLMRGKSNLAVAMRSPDNKIIIQEEKLEGIYQNKYFQIPFVRGLTILWDSMILGMKYLTISANLQAKENEKIEGSTLITTVFISITLAIIIFFVLPMLVAGMISNFLSLNAFQSNILEGLVRLVFIILYLWVISSINDIKRVFSYHGAEHKTINAFEDNAHLNVTNVMKYPTAHPRCGTSFLLTLVVLSIIVFSIIGDLSLVTRLISRILMIPILAMLSYETIRFFGNHMDQPIIHFLQKPNLFLQRLTTREPTSDMVEVAIKAFKTLQRLEQEHDEV